MNVRSFQIEKLALDVEATTIAAQRTARSDYAMARDDDGDRIPVVRHAYGAESLRVPDGARDVGVAAGLTIRDGEERLPARTLKICAAQIERNRELTALAREILAQLLNVWGERRHRLAKLDRFRVQLLYTRFKLKANQPLCAARKE